MIWSSSLVSFGGFIRKYYARMQGYYRSMFFVKRSSSLSLALDLVVAPVAADEALANKTGGSGSVRIGYGRIKPPGSHQYLRKLDVGVEAVAGLRRHRMLHGQRG
jgi:hypothetical protein